MDDPYGVVSRTHNYPSPNAARSHTHSAANLVVARALLGHERRSDLGPPRKVALDLLSPKLLLVRVRVGVS